ncbi:hypothetical protein ACP4OV_000449 [Aristida adscensionis]
MAAAFLLLLLPLLASSPCALSLPAPRPPSRPPGPGMTLGRTAAGSRREAMAAREGRGCGGEASSGAARAGEAAAVAQPQRADDDVPAHAAAAELPVAADARSEMEME